MYFSGHSDCLVLVDLYLYEPFLENLCVLLPEVPWGWGNIAAFNKATLGCKECRNALTAGTCPGLERIQKIFFFLISVAEK